MYLLHNNFHSSVLRFNGETFYNSKYIQADKAESCNDDIIIAKIGMIENPCDIKRHGNNIKGFIPPKWECNRARDVAYAALINKFGQNEELGNNLIKAEEKSFFETITDRLWSCGLKLNSATLMDKSTLYKSGGLMFEVLLAVCEE